MLSTLGPRIVYITVMITYPQCKIEEYSFSDSAIKHHVVKDALRQMQ